MVNAGEAIPKLVPAKAGTALEAATLPSYQIKFDRLLSLVGAVRELPLFERLDIDVAELNRRPFALQTDFTGRYRTHGRNIL